MAIFSRRILQRLIDENARFLLEGQTKKHIQLLNRMTKDKTLAVEWEVVLLNALSKVGKVSHEKNFGGSSNPDIYFETFDNPKANFVADITAISDKGSDKSNPFKALSNMLHQLVKESGLPENSFNLRVGRHPGPAFKGGPKVKLKLPGHARFLEMIFGEGFKEFIHRILANPQTPDRYEVKNADADVEIAYNPEQRYATGGHPSYTILYSITENTAFQALESKASQLLKTGFSGPLGIFLCDGGSRLFGNISTAGLSYSIDEVIHYFLSINQEIQFVITFSIGRKNPYSTFPHIGNSYINLIRFYNGKKCEDVTFDLERSLKLVPDQLPLPECEPYNALNWLNGKSPDIGRSNWGGMQLRPGNEITKVKISSRALVELLAGKVAQKEFFEAHGFIASEPMAKHVANPFSTAMQRGQLIHGVSIERSAVEDDDWITFELEGPDPAISPFEVPAKDKKSAAK